MSNKKPERSAPSSLLEASSSKISLTRVIIIFSAIILLLNCGIVVKRGFDSYQISVQKGEVDSTRLTHTLSDHIELTFLAADLALKRATERQYFNTLFGDNLLQDMLNNFMVMVNETPQISAMLMTDEKGEIQIIYQKQGYKTWMEGKSSIKDEPFFQAHSQSTDSELLYVGWQNSWIKDHAGFVVMSRRLNRLDGEFGGIVLIAVNSDYIFNFFNSIEKDKQTKLTLIRNAQVWDVSAREKSQLLITQIKSDKELAQLNYIMEARGVRDSSKIISEVVGGEVESSSLKIFSFSNIPNLHLILSVVTYGKDILAEWREQRTNDVIFLIIFMLFVLVVSFFAIAVTKQMQRAQRSEALAVSASQAKSDFLANMSHELRTPLNAIIGFSEMLEAGYFGKVNEKQKERLHDVTFCGTHLLELINDILEFSKGEAGKIELRLDVVSLPTIIRDTVRIFSERSKKDHITITYNAPKKMPFLRADGRKIRQILLNLLSNAVKFTKENGKIEVSCYLDEKNNFVFAVKDNGIGILEKDLPKALSVFGQVHDDPTKGGTGLGLPLCKMFAELHGGKLILQSVYGVGTTVSVILPASLMAEG